MTPHTARWVISEMRWSLVTLKLCSTVYIRPPLCALPSAPHVPALCPIAPAFDRALGGAETCSMGGDKARGVPPKKAQLAALRPFRPPGRPPQPDHRGGGVGKNQ